MRGDVDSTTPTPKIHTPAQARPIRRPARPRPLDIQRLEAWAEARAEGWPLTRLAVAGMPDYVALAARVTGESVADICSRSKTREHVDARQVAMWLARTASRQSYPAIGRYMGRDHATVMHAVRRIAAGDRARCGAAWRAYVAHRAQKSTQES